MYKGYFFDLDGVAYNGTEVITTCRDFVNGLIKANKSVCFLTNNSSRTKQTVCQHLTELGYQITEDHILTSSEVTAHYVKEQQLKRLYLIGMEGLHHEIGQLDVKIVEENADAVIIGLDKQLTYEKLAIASLLVKGGARFISTNSDLKLSTEKGVFPGNGSITKVIETTTGVPPIYMGKPETKMFELGLEMMQLKKEDVVMVGDNYHTDILGAISFGIDSIFVETGIMNRHDLLPFDILPTHIVTDLSEFKE
jgi:4-nitrophenyl phosphatase